MIVLIKFIWTFYLGLAIRISFLGHFDYSKVCIFNWKLFETYYIFWIGSNLAFSLSFGFVEYKISLIYLSSSILSIPIFAVVMTHFVFFLSGVTLNHHGLRGEGKMLYFQNSGRVFLIQMEGSLTGESSFWKKFAVGYVFECYFAPVSVLWQYSISNKYIMVFFSINILNYTFSLSVFLTRSCLSRVLIQVYEQKSGLSFLECKDLILSTHLYLYLFPRIQALGFYFLLLYLVRIIVFIWCFLLMILVNFLFLLVIGWRLMIS